MPELPLRCWRLRNFTEEDPGPGLYFLKKESAEAYKDLVRWPYAQDGKWPLPGGGELPLDQVDLKVEGFEAKAVVDPELDAVIWDEHGRLGRAYVLTGQCFDPDSWRPFSLTDFGDPVLRQRLDLASERLRNMVNLA